MTSNFTVRNVSREVTFSHKKGKEKKKTLYMNFHNTIIHNTEKVGEKKNPNWWGNLKNVV